MMELDDARIVELYRAWSEDTWRAGFMSPDPSIVNAFRQWLAQPQQQVGWTPETAESYELEMLAEYHRQENGG